MLRRDFIKSASATGIAASVPFAQGQSQPSSSMKPATRPEAPDMIYRELGTTGERVSAIGLGGAHLGGGPDAASKIRLARSAIDHGITFLDNCWDYSDGLAEVRMGQALRDGYRSKVFLMTKMDGRNKETYNKQLEQSLGRLQTDMIDLVQFHEIIRMEDPDRIFAPGGAMEAAVEARQAGKIRYIGFTGHKDPAVHLRMLEMAQKHNFHFDTVQMPINVMDAHFRSFTHEVLPVAVKQGIGVLAMKTFGGSYILNSKTVEPMDALHYGLTLPISVLITGIDSEKILDQALTAAKTFKPLSESQVAAILAKTKDAASEGRYELFKTSNRFDGTAANPKWLG
ncbi:aldo/keto reductase [Edaphobacter sp. 12200R-103]|jgi:predicted aldo/keto reductase-like oxidoreductase|uniref:aldo/keto reductase n=1 Tax=Edaphobacter sp. 12200R-103 TaxID=2703788 RepID=UPI00138D157F|nr:aldo/keto reductase [Edaphobacter sp. 12200R-103]QHS51441.1 aldo/keto reductase [Edaphobacter sp. 12200R-103]